MLISRSSTALLLVFSLVAACSESGGGGSPGDAGLMPDASSSDAVSADVESYVRAACEAQMRCGRTDPLFSLPNVTMEECLATSYLFCPAEWATLTLPSLNECLAAWRSDDCKRDPLVAPVPPACESARAVLNGGGPPRRGGTRCGNGTFCEPGWFCDQTRATSCGACRPSRKPGELCIGALFECELGSECEEQEGTLRCVAQPKLGESCVPGQWCAEGECRNGLCVEPPNLLGSACDGGFECSFPLSCIDGVCQEGKEPGEACATSDECRGLAACAEGKCTLPSMCRTGEAGSVCGTSASCGAGLSCEQREDRCVPTSQLGDPCSSDDLCADGLTCDLPEGASEPVCVTLPAVSDCDCLNGLGCTEPECATLANCE